MMNTINYKKVFLPGICFLLFCNLNVLANTDTSEEWIEIETIVNVLDGSDANSVDSFIRKTNEILKQAHIKLTVKKTNKNVQTGDGDSLLTRNEGNKAIESGQGELQKTLGAGKGIKITVADDVWTQNPSTVGWAVHRNPVMFVESDEDPNVMGRTAAHEIIHALTVSEHSEDQNDVMYESETQGTNMRPSDINEIFPNAKKRGTSYYIEPTVLPEKPVLLPPGINYSIDAHGAILDEFYDVNLYDPIGKLTDPNNPSIQYADLREVQMFCDEPFDSNSNVSLEIQLGGLYPQNFVDSFFDIFFDLNTDINGPEAMLEIHVTTGQDPSAIWYDVSNGFIFTLPDTIVHRNEIFDGNAPAMNNDCIEQQIPIELLSLNLKNNEPIEVRTDFHADDYRNGFSGPPIQLDDGTDHFDFSLSFGSSCPGIMFSEGVSPPEPMNPPNMVVTGCGFDGQVRIILDNFDIGMTEANNNGIFTYFISTGDIIPFVVHEVTAIELDDSGPKGAAHAMGYFIYNP
jgi:hypothetical protein